MEEKCIFCAIVNNQIPSFKVYEDDKFLAFLDIRPVNKGHTLVIPKTHHRWTYDVPEFGSYFEVAKKIAISQLKSLEAKFIQFITAGLEVPHAHIHVIPRFENDGHGLYPDPSNIKQINEQEMKETAEKIKTNIPEENKLEEIKEEPKQEKELTEEEVTAIKRDLAQT